MSISFLSGLSLCSGGSLRLNRRFIIELEAESRKKKKRAKKWLVLVCVVYVLASERSRGIKEARVVFLWYY